MSKRLPISCYIRTKNEADRIVRTIEAALKVCDEVVVVDSDSSDDTVAVAQAAGARVVSQSWLGNGKQKRIGEAACRHNWLLDLDADEIVSEELAEAIHGLFAVGEPTLSVYQLKLVTVPPFGKTWEKSCLAWRNKLYDKRIFSMPDHAAWDQLELARSVQIGRLEGALYHLSFRDIGDMLSKMNRVSTVRAREKSLKGFRIVQLRVLFGFPFYFMKKYLKQQMFREGVYGFACAVVLAGQRWLTDVKMYERHRMMDKG